MTYHCATKPTNAHVILCDVSVYQLCLYSRRTSIGWNSSGAATPRVRDFFTSEQWPGKLHSLIRISQIIVYVEIVYSIGQFSHSLAIAPQILQLLLSQCSQPYRCLARQIWLFK